MELDDAAALLTLGARSCNGNPKMGSAAADKIRSVPAGQVLLAMPITVDIHPQVQF